MTFETIKNIAKTHAKPVAEKAVEMATEEVVEQYKSAKFIAKLYLYGGLTLLALLISGTVYGLISLFS